MNTIFYTTIENYLLTDDFTSTIRNYLKKLVYDWAIPHHRYLRHFQVPQFADYKPLRRILATPSKTRCRKSAPICILLGASKKCSTAQKVRIFTCFRATPTRSDPQAAIMPSTGGPSATRFFTRFRRTPTRSDPEAAIMHSVWGPSVRLRCAACDETSIRAGPFGVRPGAPPLSVSIWRLGEGAFFPRAFRSTLEVPFLFVRRYGKEAITPSNGGTEADDSASGGTTAG